MVRRGRGPAGEDAGQGENGSCAGGIIVGAVVVGVARRVGRANAEVVEVRGQQNDLIRQRTAAQNADRVPCLFAGHILKLRETLLDPLGQRVGKRDLLQKGAVLASGFEAERLQLGGDEEGCDVLVACSRAATVKLVVGQKVHICVNFMFERCRFSSRCVE